MTKKKNTFLRIKILAAAVVTLLGVVLLVSSSGTAIGAIEMAVGPALGEFNPAFDGPILVPFPIIPELYNIGAYASDFSVAQGSSISLHISTNAPDPFSIQIYREGDTREYIQTISNLNASVKDCTGNYDTGCDWPVVVTFTIPQTWKSGVYTVDVPRVGGTTKAIFVVREGEPGSTARMLLVSAVMTWNCYNYYGGKSCYNGTSTDNVASTELTFDRPLVKTNGGSQLEFNRWEKPFIQWAEREGYAMEHITDFDLEYEPDILNAYDVVVIAGHNEYWTWNARQAVKGFINQGGRFVNLSGNTMWKQVRFEGNGRTMILHRSTASDPIQDPQLTTGQNWDQPINDSAYFVTGAHWRSGGYPLAFALGYGGYWAQNTNHWIFAGTNLQDNDVFGRNTSQDDSLFEHEADGLPFNCAADGSTITGPIPNTGTPKSYTILGIAPVNNTQNTFYNIAAMGIYTVPGGGAAFNANTTGWSIALGTADPVLSRITKNVLNRFLAGNVPEEPKKIDSDHLFVDRFNCSDLAQGSFPQASWKNNIADTNYYETNNTDNLLTAGCGITGSGLKLVLGSSKNGMSYQTQLMPDWSSQDAIRTSMVLNLANTTLAEGAVFDFVRYYNDPRLGQSSVLVAALQLSRVNGKLAMRFQPAGKNLPWRVVPSNNTFMLETVWNQPDDQVQIVIDGFTFQENLDLSVSPAINRVDYGLVQPVGANSGSLCLDDFIIDKLGSDIVINELHYNPSPNQGSEDDYEFLELVNNSSSATALDGFTISGDINFTFPSATSLDGGEIILLAKNAATYSALGCQVFQWTNGSLSNVGGNVQLADLGGNTADIVTYDIDGDWPSYPNGDGPSLELAGTDLDNALAASWHASSAVGGSPCAPNSNGTPDAPANDDFDSPTVIGTVPYTTTLYALGATTAVDDPELVCGAGEQGMGSVWYSFTPAVNGLLTADTFGSSYDTALSIWRGERGSLEALDCDNDNLGEQSQMVAVPLTGGTTYQMGIASSSDSLGILDLHVHFTTGVTVTQDIQLNTGWNLISSYVVPDDRALEILLAGIENDMVLLKNGEGQIYWPPLSINSIGNWDVRDGYLIYMNNPATLTITGQQVDPAQTPIVLLAGWNMVSFLPDTAIAVDLALEGIGGNLVLAKNKAGELYWPAFDVNQIGTMDPGEGYQLYTNTPVIFLYP